MQDNTYPITISNRFHVTDTDALIGLLDSITWDRDSHLTVETYPDGTCAFSNDAAITGLNGNTDDEDAVYEGLQALVPEDDAIVVIEMNSGLIDPGNALVTVITANGIDYTSIYNEAERRARRLTGNRDFYMYRDLNLA